MNIFDSAKITQSDLEIINRILTEGNCIGLPTETVYGLAADATNGLAVARIFEMKCRPKFNPLICHVSSIEMAEGQGEFSPLALKLAATFWPGPLTMVVPLKESSTLHQLVTAGLGSVGLRQPEGIAAKIIAEYGKPLAAPSANRSGKISPTTAKHVNDAFPDLSIIDHGSCDVGLESTIIKIEGNNVSILRPGAITGEMIAEVTGEMPNRHEGGKIEAPGMMKSHYAPNALVHLNITDFATDSAVLGFGEIQTSDDQPVFNLSEKANLKEAASNLYAGLKTLDQDNIKVIEVSPIPGEGLGIAINDRLERAAAPRNQNT